MAKTANRAGTIRKKTVTRNGKKYTYWEARYTIGVDTGTGKQIQKSITGKTQKEVKEKLTKIVHEIDRGTFQLPNKITVATWLTEWLSTYCANTVKPLTYAAYQSIIKNHITPTIGTIELQILKGVHVQKMYNTMIDNGLSGKTIKNAAAVLHKALCIALKQELVQINACDYAELPKTKQREIHPLTDEEIPLFLSAIEQDPFRNAYALCLFAGLREGECLGLSWDNIDFKNHKITICQQLQQEKKQGGQYYIAPTTKSGKQRTIEPPIIAFEYLQNERVKQLENRLKAGTAWDNPNNLVFANELGRTCAFTTFYKHFKKLATAIGRPDARPHDLRHTAATVAIASGADVKSVQSLLGHATASFTVNIKNPYEQFKESKQFDFVC